MAIRKVKTGWQVDIQAGGRTGKRVRKSFKTQAEAKRYEAYIKAQVAKNPEWNPKPKDTRRLSQLVKKWYELHGRNLVDVYGRMKVLEACCKRWGDPVALDITTQSYIEYRNLRLNKKKHPPSPRTLNHELMYIRAVFNELSRLDEWQHENPLAKVRKLKVFEDELSYLSSEEVKLLLHESDVSRNKDLGLIVRICLATGARWSEAECLRAEQINNNRITYTRTKNGKNRTIPISDNLNARINVYKNKKKTGRLFKNSIFAFKEALARTEIILPSGQSSHVLRHTYASHFMINGGDIITLQRLLGHSTITVTMRYAHLSPNHLQDSINKNPLAQFEAQESIR